MSRTRSSYRGRNFGHTRAHMRALAARLAPRDTVKQPTNQQQEAPATSNR